MINVIRGERPTSLDRPEIQEYLEKVAAYNLLDEVEKTKTKQPNAGDYRSNDVLDAFDRDFHSKCYLTEQKHANSWAMDVEHFRSKAFGQSPELKYDWQNLYPCSHDANILKPNKEPIGGYLDPCDTADDVEKEIIYYLGFNGEANFNARNEQNIKAKNTSNLLEKVHNGNSDKDVKLKTATLRLYINKKADEVKELIMAWQAMRIAGNIEEEVRLKIQIKNILSRKSDFTTLLRSLSCIKHIPKDFLD